MNQLIWAAMREYVQAEVKLAVEDFRYAGATPDVRRDHLEPLREQVTRFETLVRRLTDEHELNLGRIAGIAQRAAGVAAEANSRHVRYCAPMDSTAKE